MRDVYSGSPLSSHSGEGQVGLSLHTEAFGRRTATPRSEPRWSGPLIALAPASDDAFWLPKERAWKAAGIDCGRNAYIALWKEQNGRCGICELPADAFSKGLALDHDHQTHEPRGLLCFMDNYLLGRCEVELATGARSRLTRRQRGYLYRFERRRSASQLRG